MKIKTKLCYQSNEESQFQKLGIDSKNKEEYSKSDFIFDLTEVTGIDSPLEGSNQFVVFLKGTRGLLIEHNYKELMDTWLSLKK